MSQNPKRLNYKKPDSQFFVRKRLMNSLKLNKENFIGEPDPIVYRLSDKRTKKADNLKTNTVQIDANDSINHVQMKNLSQLSMEYKLSLQYSPSIGIYLMPTIEDFFGNDQVILLVWQFQLFLREGYYKDCQLKGKIQFSKESSRQITSAVFLTPVYHPLVNFQNGQIDINRLNYRSQSKEGEILFAFLLSLKDMFTNPQVCKLQGSYNDQASKTYRKSEILFVEKVFETSILQNQDENRGRTAEDCFSGQISQNLNLDQTEFFQQIHQKLTQICPKNQLINSEFSCKNQEEQSTEQKISRFLKTIMNTA